MTLKNVWFSLANYGIDKRQFGLFVNIDATRILRGSRQTEDKIKTQQSLSTVEITTS